MMDLAAFLLVAALAASADPSGPAPAPRDSAIAALVSAQVQPGDELRVRGGFGQVLARASLIGPDGLHVLLPPHGLTDPAPARALAWSEIDRIERGVGHRKDGRRIGLVVGGFLGLALTMSWISNADSGESSPLAVVLGLAGGLGGAVIGRSVGGAVGAGLRSWKLVYERR